MSVTNVIGAMNEVVFVLNAVVPKNTVQEFGAVMEVQAVSVAHINVNLEIAFLDARGVIIRDRCWVV